MPIIGYFNLSSLKVTGIYMRHIFIEFEVYMKFSIGTKIYDVVTWKVPQNALSHMGFSFVAPLKKAVPRSTRWMELMSW